MSGRRASIIFIVAHALSATMSVMIILAGFIRESDNLKWHEQEDDKSMRESVGRVGQRRQIVIPKKMLETLRLREGDFVALTQQANGVLIKPKRLIDPDNVLSREESAMILKARREMREGKYVTLATLEHDLAHKRPQRRRKTA
jgi:AbrB family looped-hinge helix DNA binding protein